MGCDYRATDMAVRYRKQQGSLRPNKSVMRDVKSKQARMYPASIFVFVGHHLGNVRDIPIIGTAQVSCIVKGIDNSVVPFLVLQLSLFGRLVAVVALVRIITIIHMTQNGLLVGTDIGMTQVIFHDILFESPTFASSLGGSSDICAGVVDR